MKIDQSWHVTTTIKSLGQYSTRVFLQYSLRGKMFDHEDISFVKIVYIKRNANDAKPLKTAEK